MKHAVTTGIGILAICRTGCSISVTAKLYPVKKGVLPGAAPDSGASSARGSCAAELRGCDRHAAHRRGLCWQLVITRAAASFHHDRVWLRAD